MHSKRSKSNQLYNRPFDKASYFIYRQSLLKPLEPTGNKTRQAAKRYRTNKTLIGEENSSKDANKDSMDLWSNVSYSNGLKGDQEETIDE